MEVETRDDLGTERSIECWDDDDDLQCYDDLQFRSPSAAASTTGSVRMSGHRDSVSSRLSARSELESNIADDDWQVLLRDNDTATEEAIASAHKAGIPIPNDIPKSALLGGTIKKLNGKKTKKMAIDDWSEDLDIPRIDGPLALTIRDTQPFPDTLLQVGTSTLTSTANSSIPSDLLPIDISPSRTGATTRLSLSSWHDDLDDPQDAPTIKLPHGRSPMNISNSNYLTSPLLDMDTQDTQDFEKDFDIPANAPLLKLAALKEAISPPTGNIDDLDIDWAEGSSIGVRFGGTKREGRSTYSSSISALSPSMSSCLTGESEEDAMEGLVLPDGPLNFENSLKKLQESNELKDIQDASLTARMQNQDNEADFFADLDVGDGNVFRSPRLNLHTNIKHANTRPTSPRRVGTSITFTNKSLTGVTRIPRLSGHDRSHSNLEPVLESSDSMPKFRRTPTRLAAQPSHSSNSSTSQIPSINTASPPSTPSATTRRSFGSRQDISRTESATSTKFLRTKRSMPAMRPAQSSLPAQSFQRPPSRQDSSGRPSSTARPKTPVEHPSNSSRFSGIHRSQVPFLPAGSSQSQSHHVNVKYSRYLRQQNSDSSNELPASQRSTSRLSLISRPDTPGRLQYGGAEVETLAITKRTITRPARRQNFGDGSELQNFDDLPTSASLERTFVKTPIGHGAPRSFRSKLSGSTPSNGARTQTPVPPLQSQSSLKPRDTITPRFARDTTASRNAREQRIASLSAANKDRENGPLLPLSTNWRSQGSSRVLDCSINSRSRRAKASQNKPHLIRPMGTGVHEAKCESQIRCSVLSI